MFEVGHRVWSFYHGWGVVSEITDDVNFPVRVKFDNGRSDKYSAEGQEYLFKSRCLFFEEIAIPDSALNPPRWRADEGKTYYTVNGIGEISEYVDFRDRTDDIKFDFGNYFKTRVEASESKFYKVYREKDVK